MNIFSGKASADEVKNFIGERPVITAYAKDQNGPSGIYYEFSEQIRHPVSGKALYPVKGYCDPNNTNTCYYAEFRDAEGNAYHYLDSRYYPDPQFKGTQSIRAQIHEDEAEYSRRYQRENAEEKAESGGRLNAWERSVLEKDETAAQRGTEKGNAWERSVLESGDTPARAVGTEKGSAWERSVLDNEDAPARRGGTNGPQNGEGASNGPLNGL